MLIRVEDDNSIVLLEKALMIKDFRNLYEHMCKTADADLAASAFAFLHYMYHFDSRFVLKYPDEKERIQEVKKFIHRGSEIKLAGTRIIKKAMDTYKELYDEEQVTLYRVMYNNLFRLREYAKFMVLYPTPGELPEDHFEVVVDSKEFTTVNSILPKQQKELEDFEKRLIESNKNRIDIYGGREENVYE